MDKISIRGARTHNLKGIDVDIPRDKLVVITGVSGSGKSSLAFDTLYAEGQRRYVESLSTYARQFLSLMDKPDVDHIEGLSPAISIEQKSTSHNPRSTVGTITEIYDYLRLLYARVGDPRCPEHGASLQAQSVTQMVDQVLALPEGAKIMLLAPVVQNRKGEHTHLLQTLKTEGFVRIRLNGQVLDLDEMPALDKNKKHTIDVVIDRFKVRPDIRTRLADSFETALARSQGLAIVDFIDQPQQAPLLFSSLYACPICGYSLNELEPRLFSFNSPLGACDTCDGLGSKQYFDPELVVTMPENSIAEGAIRGWDRRNAYYFHLMEAMAQHYDFSLNTPYRELPARAKKKILFGTGKETVEFKYTSDRGRRVRRAHPFEGVIPNMERRYRDTDSNSVREELTKYISLKPCADCGGDRLNAAARHVLVADQSLPQVCSYSVAKSKAHFESIKLHGAKQKIAEKILKEIVDRLAFLVNVGLEYLTLNRAAETLSGGEAQRIRLASQIGAGLVGVTYVLDEPSIGLHQRDNERLLNTLTRLRDMGNTVVVVEHDEDAIRRADFVLDIGPLAGDQGGEVVAAGTIDDILVSERSVTGQFLSGKRQIEVPETICVADADRYLKLKGASQNNLKQVDLNIPVGLFTCVTGVSGSGKSTLVNGTLYPICARALNGARQLQPGAYESIEGLDLFDKVVDIDQSPIGRTPRSNPATYTGLFTVIRDLFAATPEARARGYKPGRFSFNVRGGRCEACQGDGLIKVEMHFLSDVYVMCDECKGKRYNRETLEVYYKGKSIHEVLEMRVEQALDFFDAIPALEKKLTTLLEVGLGYIRLGQSATTLSGGEAQRIKLARELSKRDTGSTLYILDEPTTGLHFHDIEHLLQVIHELRDRGNTLVVIEHNLDVIKTADWVIDLGPEGGELGGQIIAEGAPHQVIEVESSLTGQFLSRHLSYARNIDSQKDRSQLNKTTITEVDRIARETT